MGAVTTINAVAPIRICDIGGWTDTWFAGHGTILNLAVTPGVGVTVRVRSDASAAGQIVLDVQDYGDRYSYELSGGSAPGRHPLIEAVVRSMSVPGGVGLEITIHSDAPPGGST